MNKKKVFIIAPFSLYGNILDNFNKIFNNGEIEIVLPYNFYYYRLSQNDYSSFLIPAQAELNIQNKTNTLATNDELIAKAKELKTISMLEEKFKYAYGAIQNCDQVVYITDNNTPLYNKENKELSREIKIAIDKNKPFVNINLQNLDELKPYQNLYRLSDENHFLNKEYDFALIPYHLYYVVDKLDNSSLSIKNKPYNWDNTIDSSKKQINKWFENNYSLTHKNNFERLLMTLFCDIEDELNNDRIKYNEEMIEKSKHIVAFIDNHAIRKDDIINKLIEYAINKGKTIEFIDINRLKNIYLPENPTLITEPITNQQKIKSL